VSSQIHLYNGTYNYERQVNNNISSSNNTSNNSNYYYCLLFYHRVMADTISFVLFLCLNYTSCLALSFVFVCVYVFVCLNFC
jgi:hypothetical protein